MPIDLMTTQGENLTGTPWQVYPRPQMRRDNWLNLNGEWDFESYAGPAVLPIEYYQKISVPFCPESKLSGVGRHIGEGENLFYRRIFVLPENFNQGKVLLHIGAADQRADVFVNGKPVGTHKGGYEAFSFDITDYLKEKNIQIT